MARVARGDRRAIRALKEKNTLSVAENVRIVLKAISENLDWWQIIDPANTNNIISDDLTMMERSAIASRASMALTQTWGDVVT